MREDWIECELGEVLVHTKAKHKPILIENLFYVGLEHIEKETGRLTENVGIDEIKTVKNKFEKGQILYGKLRPYFNKVHLTMQSGVCSTDILVFQPTKYVHSKFALNYIMSRKFVNEMSANMNGVNLPRVSTNTVTSYTFPLPPLVEQKAIVKKIEPLFSSLDSGIADLKKAQDQLVIYRQAVLKKAFEGGLTKEWRERNPYSMDSFLNKLKEEKANAVKSKLIQKSDYFPIFQEKELTYKVPKNWVSLPWKTTTSNNKYAMKRGPFGSALKKAFFVEKGIVVYEQGHAINDEPFRHRYFITPEKFEELKAFKTKGGDMIISCSGATLGRICLLPENGDIGVINQALLKIDLDEKILFKKFFIMMFRSETFQRLIFAKSLGTAMPNMIGMKELKEIPIPIPSIEEQKQIILEVESRLSVCDKVEKDITESLEKAQALRQSILKKAFEGNLLSEDEIAACKADPDYEPAGVLLERIKAEKKK